MSNQIEDKKRSFHEISGHVDVPVGDLGQQFKSKADFHNYWVKTPLYGVTNVHSGPLSNRFKAFEDLNGRRVVVSSEIVFHDVAHVHSSLLARVGRIQPLLRARARARSNHNGI